MTKIVILQYVEKKSECMSKKKSQYSMSKKVIVYHVEKSHSIVCRKKSHSIVCRKNCCSIVWGKKVIVIQLFSSLNDYSTRFYIVQEPFNHIHTLRLRLPYKVPPAHQINIHTHLHSDGSASGEIQGSVSRPRTLRHKTAGSGIELPTFQLVGYHSTT